MYYTLWWGGVMRHNCSRCEHAWRFILLIGITCYYCDHSLACGWTGLVVFARNVAQKSPCHKNLYSIQSKKKLIKENHEFPPTGKKAFFTLQCSGKCLFRGCVISSSVIVMLNVCFIYCFTVCRRHDISKAGQTLDFTTCWSMEL